MQCRVHILLDRRRPVRERPQINARRRVITDLPEFLFPHPKESQWDVEWKDRKKWNSAYQVFRTLKSGVKSIAAAMCAIDLVLPTVCQRTITNSTFGNYTNEKLQPIRDWIDGQIGDDGPIRTALAEMRLLRFGRGSMEHHLIWAIDELAEACRQATNPRSEPSGHRMFCQNIVRACLFVWREFTTGLTYGSISAEEEQAFLQLWLGRVEAKFAFSDAITCELE